MRLRPVPAVATWFLRLFCSSAEHESLIGDLLERYRQGRSRFWYWRQVLGIVFLRSRNPIAIRQVFNLILVGAVLAAVLLSDIWLIFAIGILGGIIAGILIFLLGSVRHQPAKPDMLSANTGSYHRGISISHIPVEGAVGLLFVVATVLIFGGGVPAIRAMLVVIAPLGIIALGALVYWHRRNPVDIHSLDLHR